MAGRHFFELRHLAPASLDRERATGAEDTAGWGIGSARHVALEHLALARPFGIGLGDRGEERARIGMLGRRIKPFAGCYLHDPPEIEYGDLVGEIRASFNLRTPTTE